MTMAIYLPSTAEEEQLALDELTPREIVVELDKHVIGQKDAKRAVAIALRNRMRRQKLAPELAVPESGGFEVYGGRVRGARCGVDGARSGGDRHRQCARREVGGCGRQG